MRDGVDDGQVFDGTAFCRPIEDEVHRPHTSLAACGRTSD